MTTINLDELSNNKKWLRRKNKKGISKSNLHGHVFALLKHGDHDQSSHGNRYGPHGADENPDGGKLKKPSAKTKDISVNPTTDQVYWKNKLVGQLIEKHGKIYIKYMHGSTSSKGYDTKKQAAKHAAFHAAKYEGTEKAAVVVDPWSGGMKGTKPLKHVAAFGEGWVTQKPITEGEKESIESAPEVKHVNPQQYGLYSESPYGQLMIPDSSTMEQDEATKEFFHGQAIKDYPVSSSKNKSVVIEISEKFGASKESIDSVWASWNMSSNGNQTSLKLQYVAEKIFGFAKNSEWQRKQIESMGANKTNDLDKIADAAAAIYKYTQEKFAEKGITHVTLYRGTGKGELAYLKDNPDIEPGDSAEIQMNSLESWSLDPHFAKGWGTIGLKVTVPVKRVFGTGVTGLGTYGEKEFVLLGDGNKDKAIIVKVEGKGTIESKIKKASRPVWFIDLSEGGFEDWNWLHSFSEKRKNK